MPAAKNPDDWGTDVMHGTLSQPWMYLGVGVCAGLLATAVAVGFTQSIGQSCGICGSLQKKWPLYNQGRLTTLSAQEHASLRYEPSLPKLERSGYTSMLHIAGWKWLSAWCFPPAWHCCSWSQ